MKKFLTCMLCAMLLLMLIIPVFACEDPGCTQNHSTAATSVSTNLPDDLDKDADGIPDYMDNCIDVDGDGIQDIDPTYQTPGESKFRKPLSEFQWITIILGCLLLIVIAATLIHKHYFQNKEEE